MASSTFSTLAIVIFTRGIIADNLYSSCLRNSDCLEPNSQCTILSPTCGRGTCVCVPGFIEDLEGTAYRCRRLVEFNAPCDDYGDVCSTVNAKCIDGKCQCTPGFQTGPGSSIYTCTKGAKPIGAECLSNDECYSYGNLECRDQKCQCQGGFRSFDSHRCTRRNVGDSCESNWDCSAMFFTICNEQGKCDCNNQTVRHLVTIPVPVDRRNPMLDNTIRGYACYPPQIIPFTEGYPCSSGYEHILIPDESATTQTPTTQTTSKIDYFYVERGKRQSDYDEPSTPYPVTARPLGLCEAPFQCTYCSLFEPICASTYN